MNLPGSSQLLCHSTSLPLLLLALLPAGVASAQAPDLRVRYVRTSLSTVRAGQTVVVSCDVINAGGPTPWGNIGWQDGIYLRSTTAAPSASVTPLFNRFINPPWSMQNGFTYSGYPQPLNPDITIRIPATTSPGIYHVGYFANRMRSAGWAIGELDYSDNYGTREIVVEGGPNYVVSSLAVPTTPWRQGATLLVDLTVRNTGGTVGNVPTTVALFLSSTTQPQGLPLATVPVPALAMGATHPIVGLPVTMPSAGSGAWNLVAFADAANVVAEISETDNTRAAPITVGPTAAVSNYGTGCPGRQGLPTLRGIGLPTIGTTSFELEAGNLPPWTLVGLLLGFSDTTWNGRQLPLDLTPWGMPGCVLLQDMRFDRLANNGTATTVGFAMPVPASAAFAGLRFFAQAFVHDPTANPAGVAATAGLRLEVGY
ncbi:MAG: hypothetical protein IPK26_01525 [Planctomycetes bacterium]|nr:hypothetical protein [Planctomycetota bacterium]